IKFDKTKINNLSFTYENTKLGFTGRAEYFLMNNYHYYKEVDNPSQVEILMRKIEPTQITANINMFMISVGEKLTFCRSLIDNYAVYQKSDYMDVLQIPVLY